MTNNIGNIQIGLVVLIGLMALIVISELHGIKEELEVLNQKIGINKKEENKND